MENQNKEWIQLSFLDYCFSPEGAENGITLDVTFQWADAMLGRWDDNE